MYISVNTSKNFEVTVYESRGYLGGIMHDYLYEKDIFLKDANI